MQSTNSLIEIKAQQDKRDPTLSTLTVVAFLPPQLNLFVFFCKWSAKFRSRLLKFIPTGVNISAL